MKIIYTFLSIFLLLATPRLFAQNDLLARVEFEEAEQAYSEGKYPVAYEKLQGTERLLGQWTAKVSYMHIVTLEKICTFENYKFTVQEHKLLKEIDSYLKYTSTAGDNVIYEKFKDVVSIQKRLKPYIDRNNWQNAPGYLEAKAALENGNSALAVKLLQLQTEQGNLSAYALLGDISKNGLGGQIQDVALAQKYYTLASHNGDVAALFLAGDHENAALNGSAYAAVFMGDKYYLTDYDNKDYVKAVKFYKLAYERGIKAVAKKLSDIYATGGWYLYPDKEESKKWNDIYIKN